MCNKERYISLKKYNYDLLKPRAAQSEIFIIASSVEGLVTSPKCFSVYQFYFVRRQRYSAVKCFFASPTSSLRVYQLIFSIIIF